MATGVFDIPLISMDGSGDRSPENGVALPSLRHFVAGPENRLVCLLERLFESSPPQFNPVTLCGPTGVGKSHLLQGLVERQRTTVAGSRHVLTTGADYARGFARAVEVDSVPDWRERHRGADLFVLDDLEELVNKPAAQWELARTLDVLVDQDHQIVLASRHMLPDWTWMSPVLRSRIEGGLVIPVAPPGSETRERIVFELAAAYGVAEDAHVILSSASESWTYPRIRSAVLQQLQRLPHSVSANASRPSSRKDRLVQIAKQVARHSQVPLADLRGPSRRHSIVRARGTAIYLGRTLLGLSFEDIGKFFGERDHTTVLYSWRKTCERLSEDPSYKHDVSKLIAWLEHSGSAESGRSNEPISKFTITPNKGECDKSECDKSECDKSECDKSECDKSECDCEKLVHRLTGTVDRFRQST